MALNLTPPTRDEIIAGAKSAADLLQTAQTFDPQLAAQLTAKPLLASKSVWGVALTALLTPVVAHWGLGLDQTTVEVLSGLAVTAAGAGLRVITSGPISGLVSTPAVPK
jgi:hypothetical protein